MIHLNHYVVLGAVLFTIGALGFLTRRNVIVALMSIEVMLNAVNLTLVAFNRMYLHHTGQMFAFFIIAVAAAEAAVGLAIVLALYRVNRTVRTDLADQLKGLSMDTLFTLYPTTNFSLLAVVLLLPLLGAFVNGVFGKRLGRHGVRAMALAALGGSFVAAVVAFLMLREHAHHLHESKVADNPRLVWTAWKWMSVSLAQGDGESPIFVSFAIDALSATMMLVVTGVGFLIHLYSTAYMWEDPGFYRFFAYLNLFIFSMLVLILGDSMPLLFVGWEGVGLCSYLLIGFWFDDDKNASAGKKAFIANRIGDFGLLMGMAMLLAYTGALSFSGILAGREGLLTEVQVWPIGNLSAAAVIGTRLAFLAPLLSPVHVYAATMCGLMLFLGCAGKSAQIPLYVWLPDAMAGPTPVSALIHAATMVTAGVYLVCRLSPIFLLSPAVMATVATVGALTAFFAATIGLVQYDIKKVLAYSTVSQLGYMFLGVGVGAFADGFFHVFTHAFFKACLFLGAGSVIHAMHGRIHDTDTSQDMRNMGGLRKYLPITHATYLVSCLAIAGVPLTAGFFSKDEILAKAFDMHLLAPKVDGPAMWTAPGWLGPSLFVLGILGAVMTAFYMFRTYFLTFWGEFKGWKIVPGYVAAHAHGHDEHGHDGHDEHGHDEHGHAAASVAHADDHAAHGHDEEPLEPGEGIRTLEGPVPHESPWQMTLPLGVLAFMAIAAGYLNAKLLGETLHTEALSSLEHWLAPVFEQGGEAAAGHAEAFNPGHAWGLAVPGILAAVIGIGAAYWIYMMQKGEPARMLAERMPGLHQLVVDKWRIDELYEQTVIGAVDELALTAVVLDRWVVDGILAKLTALLYGALGRVLRLVQTGRVQMYAAAMVAGLFGVAWFFYTPHPEMTVSGDASTGAYKVQAAGGVGYKYRWDADGKPGPDSKDFGEGDEVEVKLEPGKSMPVALEVENAFHRKARKVITITRPRRDGEAMSLDELNKQLEDLQKMMVQP